MSSIASCTGFVSSKSQRIFRRFFTWLGKSIYLRYSWFIALGILLTMAITAGGVVYFFNNCTNGDCVENRSAYLWVPSRSNVWKQFTYILDEFGTFPSSMSLLVQPIDEDESITLPSNLDISYNIYRTIDTINHNDYEYEDLCLRSYPLSPECESFYGNFFGYFFGENDMLWMNESNIDSAINTPNAPTAFFLGGFEYDEDDSNVITSANSLRIVYELEGSTNLTVQDAVYEYMGVWGDYWAKRKEDYEADGISIVYYSDRSFDDEINRVVFGDAPVFVLALFVMLVYLMFTLGKLSCIRARPWLAFSAILVMLCSMLIGFSVGLMIGADFNTLAALVPFILLGVGVDDMIILVDTYDKTPMPQDNILNAHRRLGNALASSGLSISLTSFCSSMAFFVGSATDIPGISAFCLYAGWSFLANYILQFLLFVPLMVIDDRRIANSKNFCCFCKSHERKLHNQSQISFFDPEKIVKNNGTLSSTKFKDDDDDDQEMSKSRSESKCNVEFLVKITLIPLLSKRICRWIIILIFMATLSGSLYVQQFLNTDSDATKLVPDDSYILDYFEVVNSVYTGTAVDELQIIIKNQDFSDLNTRKNILAMMADLESQQDAIEGIENWLQEYQIWLSNNKGLNIDNLTSTQFYSNLQIFTNSSTKWYSEINYDSTQNPTKIVSTRFTLRVVKNVEATAQWPQYLLWNSVINDYISDDSDDDDGYAFIPDHLFAYFGTNIKRLTLDNMIFAGIGVSIILIIFLDFRMALFIVFILAMIDAHLFAWMWLFDISLDSLAYGELVMAVGLTVDYVIHITHAIADAKPKNLDTDNLNEIFCAKLKIGMLEMGTSVLKGAFTTFLGVMALIFSQSEAFRIFFILFAGIIVVAVAHGMLLAPALMGELKLVYIGIGEQQENKQNVSRLAADIKSTHKSSNIDEEYPTNVPHMETRGGSTSSRSSQKEVAGSMGSVKSKLRVGSSTVSPKRASILNAGNEINTMQMTSFGLKESDSEDSSKSEFEE